MPNWSPHICFSSGMVTDKFGIQWMVYIAGGQS